LSPTRSARRRSSSSASTTSSNGSGPPRARAVRRTAATDRSSESILSMSRVRAWAAWHPPADRSSRPTASVYPATGCLSIGCGRHGRKLTGLPWNHAPSRRSCPLHQRLMDGAPTAALFRPGINQSDADQGDLVSARGLLPRGPTGGSPGAAEARSRWSRCRACPRPARGPRYRCCSAACSPAQRTIRSLRWTSGSSCPPGMV
jgi:hypothetical protein